MKKLIDAIKGKKWVVVAGIILSALAYYFDIPFSM